MQDLLSTSAVGGVAAVFALLSLAFAFFLIRYILKQDEGSDRVKELSKYIQAGARTFMMREFRVLVIIMFVLALVLFFIPGLGYVPTIGFVLGTVAAGAAGFIGMAIATRANGRTAHAAQSSFSKALGVAYSGGATMGFSVVGLGLLGLAILYLAFPDDSTALLGYAFGSSIVALFLRVGGGIYTKSADVGADVVGKIEAGIPEDSPRNPGVIADNVGDNVGDVAGMGSDLYESYVSAIAATMFLGEQYADTLGLAGPDGIGIYLALLLATAGILSAIVGSFFVRTSGDTKDHEQQTTQAQSALNRGVWAANILFVALAAVIIFSLMDSVPASEAISGEYQAMSAIDIRWGIFLSILCGLVVGMIIGWATEYYTAENAPVKGIARFSETGAATNIIAGLGIGLISTAIPAISIGAATMIAFYFAGLYGIAIASLGMLVTLGVVLAMDAYGPITDNAAGIAEMAELGQDVREKCEALDSVGNTTAAIGKGFAIGSAALAALAWLATFFEKASAVDIGGGETVDLIGDTVIAVMDPAVIVGLLIGAMLTYVMAAVGIQATSRGAGAIVREIRRQFSEIKGVRDGTRDPDYNTCIGLTTDAAMKEMLIPGIVVVIVPLVLGILPLMGMEALAGLLVGVLITGFLTAIFMANSGGAWDNAKKYIEAGHHGGKGSEAHAASVVGDTVGDPLKDTSGPSLNVLIKLISKVAVIFLPFFAMFLV